MNRRAAIFVFTIVVALSPSINAQTTAFNYQGRLTDGGNPANGSFQMQFKLFDSLGGATQIGTTIGDVPVTVAQGNFAVKLDFGSNALSGANRWLEIAVRRNAGESYVTLTPREQIASSPYAVRTLSAASADTAATATNALNLGGVAANQYVQTNDPRLSDPRNPLPGSASYIQNGTTPQNASNFNISGAGSVGSLNVGGSSTYSGAAAPATAPSGQARLYFDSASNRLRVSENGSAYVNLVGSGISGTGTVNRMPFWSGATTLADSVITQTGANVGIGTASPFHRLALSGGPAWTTHGWGGSLDLENSAAIGWRGNLGGTRFGMGHTNDGFFMFRTISELGTASAVPIYDFKMDNAGNIGVGSLGLNTDVSQARINVFGLSLGYGLLHTLGAVSVGTYVDATGGWYGTRSNHPLHFFTNNGLQQMTLLPTGNFGVGTTNPSAKLQVVGGASVGISVSSQGNALIGTSSGAGFASVFGENTSGSTGYGVYGKSTTGFGVYSEGHAGQSINKGGFVKATLYVLANGTLARCYNGITGSSTGNCGFTVSATGTGSYAIALGAAFDPPNRFYSLTTFGNTEYIVGRITGVGTNVTIQTFRTNETIPNGDVVSDFFLVVY
jgi:hypothetical protein